MRKRGFAALARADARALTFRRRAIRVQRLYFNHDPRPDDPIFAHWPAP